MKDLIMLVEDLSFTRIQLKNILKSGGFENICEAADAKTALLLAKERRPRLVVLDITLPDREDLSLIGELKSIDPEIEIVICSATSQQVVIDQAMKLGIRKFFTKPVDAAELQAIAEKIIR